MIYNLCLVYMITYDYDFGVLYLQLLLTQYTIDMPTSDYNKRMGDIINARDNTDE